MRKVRKEKDNLVSSHRAGLSWLDVLSISLVPVRILWKAVSTLVESRAEVSMKLRLFFSAKTLASSVGTARR